jgi:hypothetical protein
LGRSPTTQASAALGVASVSLLTQGALVRRTRELLWRAAGAPRNRVLALQRALGNSRRSPAQAPIGSTSSGTGANEILSAYRGGADGGAGLRIPVTCTVLAEKSDLFNRSLLRRRFMNVKRNWRRERDSNPRRAFDPYTLSRGAPSTTRPSLREPKMCSQRGRLRQRGRARGAAIILNGPGSGKAAMPAPASGAHARTPAPIRARHRALRACCPRPAQNPRVRRRARRPEPPRLRPVRPP